MPFNNNSWAQWPTARSTPREHWEKNYKSHLCSLDESNGMCPHCANQRRFNWFLERRESPLTWLRSRHSGLLSFSGPLDEMKLLWNLKLATKQDVVYVVAGNKAISRSSKCHSLPSETFIKNFEQTCWFSVGIGGHFLNFNIVANWPESVRGSHGENVVMGRPIGLVYYGIKCK